MPQRNAPSAGARALLTSFWMHSMSVQSTSGNLSTTRRGPGNLWMKLVGPSCSQSPYVCYESAGTRHSSSTRTAKPHIPCPFMTKVDKKQDIADYVDSFCPLGPKDEEGWREDDKDLVISTLSEKGRRDVRVSLDAHR